MIDRICCFFAGRGQLLKCLLETHQICAGDDPRYILNELYITDYCIWVQSVSHVKIQSLAAALKKVIIIMLHLSLDIQQNKLLSILTSNIAEKASCFAKIRSYK